MTELQATTHDPAAVELDEPLSATRLLLQAAMSLATARDLATVTAVVRHAARSLARADGVTFVLREGDQVHYADEDAIAPLWKGRRFPADACISGWAMEHRCAVVIDDVYADPRIPQDLYRPTFVRSLAMVPVRREDPVGAIGAYWAGHHRATEGQLALLEALAGLASSTMANLALEADLRAAVAARDELIGLASHELRTPLAAVRLQVERAERLVEQAADPALVRGALARSLRAAQRLGRQLERLLDASRVSLEGVQLQLEPVDLVAVVRGQAERLADELGARVQVDAPDALTGRWDVERLEQALENVLANAAKFGAGKPIEIQVREQPGAAEVQVRDHGAGFAPGDQERIFQRFGRAVSSRHYGGFGLGLWLARRALEAHGGSIAATSAPGAGATFTLRLPRDEG
ncbi:MAG: GAF domain-containing sensor histidine kinase [Anaeromyxobacter sp.]